MSHPLLLPTPRNITLLDGVCAIAEQGVIILNAPQAGGLRFTAKQLQGQLGAGWSLAAGGGYPLDEQVISLNLVPDSVTHPEGYELTIDEKQVAIVAKTPAGIFYGTQTLRQLLAQSDGTLPTLRITDWPDFPNRGVMLDVSRDKVPTMDILYALVDQFASWKINQLQLYTEHTFAYRQHPTVWAEASPITGEEILALDAYCRKRFIELVPNQNSFGHMRRWLTKPAYKHLAEAPDGCDTIWGWFDEPFTINPSDPESLELIRSMFDELLPHFSSNQFNVGCDETVDLGGGHSKKLVAELGAGRVYLDFLLKIYKDVKRRGKTMQFWGDILMNHPELVSELPRDVIALEWGYEAKHDFAGHGAIFAASGIPFYVCPGTSSWRTVAGRTTNSLDNLRNAAENGLKNGAIGYLITDWGDEGHWQPLSVSYLPFAYGAGVAWGYEANRDVDPAGLASQFAFQDSADVMGQLAYDLGNVFQSVGIQTFNSTVLFNALQAPIETIQNMLELEDETIGDRVNNTQSQIEEIISRLESADMQSADADLVLEEFLWAGHMLRHACQRIRWVADGKDVSQAQRLTKAASQLIADHKKIWLARNRLGGYRESVARLQKMAGSYEISDGK